MLVALAETGGTPEAKSLLLKATQLHATERLQNLDAQIGSLDSRLLILEQTNRNLGQNFQDLSLSKPLFTFWKCNQ